MSAPPPGRPNGAPRPPPKANPLRPMRKRPANPLVQARRPPPKAGSSNAAGPSKPSSKPGIPNGQALTLQQRRDMYGGWSEPPPPQFQDIPIMTTKRQLIEDMRFNLMRLSQAKVDEKPIDPTDGEEWARPVTLRRRDARQPPPGRAPKVEMPVVVEVAEDEKERLAQLQAEREAQRAIDQAKIAPVAKDPNAKPKTTTNNNSKKKKGQDDKGRFQKFHITEAAKKEADTHYEEALPWHLEDADGKNVWVGSYVAALSENTVALQIEGSVFRMVPLEKWYKFTAKPPFQAFTIEQAEAFMNRKVDVGRWVMKGDEYAAQQAELEATRHMGGRGTFVKTESSTFRAASRAEKMDHDELDVSGDEFQDDDEAATFEKWQEDDDTKESATRIRREQLGANLFGAGDEQQVDKELQAELKEELDRKIYGKATKKALIKRDREAIYQSDDSEEHPWSSSSSSDSSSDEENEEDQDDKGGDSKDKDKEKDEEKDKDKSSKGGTPKGSKSKGGSESSKKTKTLKRPSSPTLSESSGNESARKKIKKTVKPAAGSRAGTPSLQQQAVKRKAKAGGAGSGSDGEATAGEMSDGAGPKKKIKVVTGSARASPAASRAGSPTRAGSPSGGASPLRAGSPLAGSGRVEAAEILEKVPPEGIAINELIQLFQGRLGDRPGQMPKQEWINMVKNLCVRGPDKRLRRK